MTLFAKRFPNNNTFSNYFARQSIYLGTSRSSVMSVVSVGGSLFRAIKPIFVYNTVVMSISAQVIFTLCNESQCYLKLSLLNIELSTEIIIS